MRQGLGSQDGFPVSRVPCDFGAADEKIEEET